MNSEIKELVDIADRLCIKLDMMSYQDKIFNTEVGIYLENASWEILRMKNDLKNIGELV